MQNKMEDPKIHAPPPQKKPRGRLATLDAKILSFCYSGSMVSWNRFCSLWLLKCGFSPREVGPVSYTHLTLPTILLV